MSFINCAAINTHVILLSCLQAAVLQMPQVHLLQTAVSVAHGAAFNLDGAWEMT